MRKFVHLFFLAIGIMAIATVSAQAPNAFSYQAVLRNSGGELITGQQVQLRFTVRENSATGTIQYRETQNVTPNAFGLVNHAVGTGTVVTGSFSGITWPTGTKFLQVELNAGSGFVDLGAERLNSVPFALHAASSAGLSGTANRLVKFTGPSTAGDSQVFDNGTNVSINNTSPAASDRFSVQDNNLRVRFKSTGTASSTATQLTFDNSSVFANQVGSIGFRGGDGGFGGYLYLNVDGVDKLRLFANGSICSQTSITVCSDQRFKKNLVPLTNVVDKLKQLNGVYFDWRADEFKDRGFSESRQIGLIAQDMEKVFPELVIAIEDGYKSVDYTMLTAVLVEAIKEQQAQIEALQSNNAELKAALTTSTKEVDALETQLKTRIQTIETMLGIELQSQN